MRLFRMLSLLVTPLACSDLPTPPSPNVAEPSLAIVDAVQGGGNESFFWLPPIVSEPESFNGPFDATQSPVVRICNLADCAADLVAEYTMTGGPESETVRVVPEDEHYIVNWHTRGSGASPGPIYRISVLVDGSELGYRDVQLASTEKRAGSITSNEILGLKDGRTLPIKFRIEEGGVSGYVPGYLAQRQYIQFFQVLGNSSYGSNFSGGTELALSVAAGEVDANGYLDRTTYFAFSLQSTTTEIFDVRVCASYGEAPDPAADRICADHRYFGLESKSFQHSLSFMADGVARPYVVQAVSATDQVLETLFSGTVRVTVPVAPSQAPVLSTSAVSVSSGQEFQLTWTAPEGNTSFILQESQEPDFDPASPGFQSLNIALSNLSRSYTRTVESPTTFYFRIKSHNLSGSSPWSNVVAVAVQP